MEEVASRKKESYKIFDEIAKTYDLLNHTLSFGIDIYWRKKMLQYLPSHKSINALDLACGTGDVPLTLVSAPEIKKITGVDLSKGMIEIGNKKIAKKGLSHKIILTLGDGTQIPAADNIFELVTLSFGIRNFNAPETSLHEIHRVLKPNGRAMIMEFSIPQNAIIRSLYFFYFRKILPFFGNLVSRHPDAYTYLNKTVEEFPYGNKFLAMMEKAGLKNLKMIPLTFGIATLYVGDKID